MVHTFTSWLPVLVVDDEPPLLHSVSLLLRTAGIAHVLTLEDSRAVLPLLAEQEVGMLLLDLTMPHLSGQEILDRVAADYPDVSVVVMTATNDLETAVHCMQAGAIDYLVKPVENNRLVSSVRRALELRSLRDEVLSLKNRFLTDRPHEREAFAAIITQSRAMFTIFRYIEAIAPSPWPVLITGETGTGKELIVQALHRLSRCPGELIAVNVAGLDDTLFSDALFGHTKGSFTGAAGPREGLITRAAEGTLFLDEIGDLTTASQVKLLRLLQDGSYYPLGADRPRQHRSRVIVATHYDVVQHVNEGAFRKDLYYRLRTHHLQLPPLRKRPEDLPLLVNHFLEKAASALGKPVPSVPLALYQLLKTYSFPGNVRELEALVLDAITRHQGQTLPLQSFKDVIAASAPLAQSETPPEAAPAALLFPDPLPTLGEAEAALIAEALRRAEGNQGVAAGMLGLSRQALNKRLSRSN
jgi:two-component system, NtrC family, nitrogen regulation response regulator GlnG